MISVSRLAHRCSACPCGHPEHIGRGMKTPDAFVCEICEQLETTEAVVIAFITVEEAETHVITDGSIVKLGDATCRVVDADQVMKLAGRYPTPCVRLKLREIPKTAEGRPA